MTLIDFTPVSGHYGNRRKSLLSPYRDEVIHLRFEGKTYAEITTVLRSKDLQIYRHSKIHYVALYPMRKDFKGILRITREEGPAELVERRWLIQLLFKPITSAKGITEEQFNTVIKNTQWQEKYMKL